MKAWAKASAVEGTVLMLADGNGDYSKALGLDMDATGFGMGIRGKRFAMIVEDGVARQVFVEAPGEFKVSSAEYVLSQL
jgi:peroxiredoxin